MSDIIEQFLKYIKEQKKYSDNTVISYQNDLETFLLFLRENNIS